VDGNEDYGSGNAVIPLLERSRGAATDRELVRLALGQQPRRKLSTGAMCRIGLNAGRLPSFRSRGP
jgi:hypothetical protein